MCVDSSQSGLSEGTVKGALLSSPLFWGSSGYLSLYVPPAGAEHTLDRNLQKEQIETVGYIFFVHLVETVGPAVPQPVWEMPTQLYARTLAHTWGQCLPGDTAG